MIVNSNVLIRFGLCLSLLVSTHVFAQEQLKIDDPWIQLGPPVATTLAAYLKIHNMSQKKQKLMAVRSDAFRAVEIHKTEIKNSMASMRKMEHVDIDPNAHVEFRHGSYHVMLIGPVKPLIEGEKIKMTFVFESTEITLDVPVRRGDSVAHHQHGDQHKKDKSHGQH